MSMPPLPPALIRRKRDGHALTPAEIDAFVRGLVDGSWSDAQAAAMAMAICLKGMSAAETVALTLAMTHSGEVLGWAGAKLGGPVLDKHSTGGVGDKVSLLLAPIVAACGGFVPMVSGRGLGHTGGTLDKLESIPGYETDVSPQRLRAALRQAGCAIVGATAAIAPADRRLYAIRDQTATVESIPLITASILAKKLAAGLDGLVIDVKTGNGAFASDLATATALARSLIDVGQGAGLAMRTRITDMNQVLGHSCGHAVEVVEAVHFLQGRRREPRLLELTRALSADLLLIGGIETALDQALARVDAVLDGGQALERLARMVAALGGPIDFVERAEVHLGAAPVQRTVAAGRAGWVGGMETRGIGLLLIALGGGRRRAGDAIDVRVGLTDVAAIGTRVDAGQPMALVHAANERDAASACDRLARLLTISDAPVETTACLRDHLLAAGA